MEYAKWNIVVNEVTKLGEGHYFFKTNVGDVTSTRVETVQNVRLSAKQEGSPIKGLGYILNPKEDMVEVILWTEFDDPNQEAILGIAGDVFINCVKKYAEYLEAGGDPEKFDKKKK